MKDTFKENFTVNGVTFNMVKVEGGSFIMGAPDKRHGDLVNFFCGLYDMVGNVWEWCNDFFYRYPLKKEYIPGGFDNPKGPASSKENLKVLRGGCWYNDALHCRTVMRVGIWLNDHCDGFGLRLALQD